MAHGTQSKYNSLKENIAVPCHPLSKPFIYINFLNFYFYKKVCKINGTMAQQPANPHKI